MFSVSFAPGWGCQRVAKGRAPLVPVVLLKPSVSPAMEKNCSRERACILKQAKRWRGGNGNRNDRHSVLQRTLQLGTGGMLQTGAWVETSPVGSCEFKRLCVRCAARTAFPVLVTPIRLYLLEMWLFLKEKKKHFHG